MTINDEGSFPSVLYLTHRPSDVDLLALFHAVQVIADQTARRERPTLRREIRLDASNVNVPPS